MDQVHIVPPLCTVALPFERFPKRLGAARCLIAPRVGPEVIATQEQLVLADTCIACRLRHPSAGIGGRDASLATVLVDLIESGLDQDGKVFLDREIERGLQGLLICCAIARQADPLSISVACD